MSLKDQLPDRLPLLADLLMDAAYADDHLEGEERMAVKRLLREILDVQTLPIDLDFRDRRVRTQEVRSRQDARGVRPGLEGAEETAHRAGGRGPRLGRGDRLRRGRAAARGRRGARPAGPEELRKSWWSTSSRRSTSATIWIGSGTANSRRAFHHLALRAISSAFSGHHAPAAGPLLQVPSDSPGGLSQ